MESTIKAVHATNRGGIPFLMPDTLADIGISDVSVAYSDFFTGKTNVRDHITSVASKSKKEGALAQYVGMAQDTFLIPASDDNQMTEVRPANKKETVHVMTPFGHQQINFEQYLEDVAALKPALAVLPIPIMPKEVPTAAAPKNVAIKMVRYREGLMKNAAKMLCKVPAKFDVPLLVPIASRDNLSEICEIVEKSEAIVGYSLSAAPLGDDTQTYLSDLIDFLPKKQIYFTTVSCPLEACEAALAGATHIHSDVPTRLASMGLAYSFSLDMKEYEGKKALAEDGVAAPKAKQPLLTNLWDRVHQRDTSPLVEGCGCYACAHHQQAYIHHLTSIRELTGSVLISAHNVHSWQRLVERLGSFGSDRAGLVEFVGWFRRVYG
ncbi:tRNA-guanine transglycosylase [Carpediemonas membranifera]|uniref:tRNA-guanine transglycosylase n=1 Tax=Carpediemonas membranifera TaxID=201153 RepID=A0A8J6E6A3_9EUKA|nr:tRNA-guanine transglycosylase [Carpediemonas membranifera]|eukprot:KAG9396862.1 tRNA-guanine transglycosylase [Carpediemonas membranifera]